MTEDKAETVQRLVVTGLHLKPTDSAQVCHDEVKSGAVVKRQRVDE